MRVPIRPPAITDDPNAAPPARAPSLATAARVWLVRHADVHDDWQKRAYGNLDIPLSARGIEETHALARAFATTPLARVASSPLSRALLLGQELARATGAPLAVDDRLREVFRGDWQGLPADEFRSRWEAERDAFAADPWNWKGHGGESDADIWARAWPALREAVLAAANTQPNVTVALATHFNVIRVLVTRLCGLRPSQSFTFRNMPAHASLVVDRAEGWVLECADVAGPQAQGGPTPM
jgi:broad specificity phosphatase PhoE